MKLSRPNLALSTALALSVPFFACSKDDGGGNSNPGTGGSESRGGAGGRSSTGGTGGSSSSGGSGGVPGGTGGMGAPTGSGGSPVTGSGGSPGGTGGTTIDAGPTTPDAPPSNPDAPPASGTCDYTPKANALGIKLKLQKIELKALPSAGGSSRDDGYSSGITEAKFFPGSATDFFIVRKVGAVYHYKLDAAEGNTATLVKALRIDNVRAGGDTGLLALAFDPGFATNKFVYFGYAVNGGGRQSVITRFTYENNELTNPQKIIDFTTSSGGALYHSIGSIGFDKDGALWALHGDWDMKGASESLDLNSLLGKLVRIIPSRAAAAGGWEPAPGNPFMADPKPKSAIYAFGLRSPWRGAVNSKGQFIVGDIGPAVNEEVNFITKSNTNLGWGPSGQTCGNVSVQCYRDGIAEFDGMNFENRRGRSVWVGPQYGDCGKDRYMGALTGMYFFGDFFAGWFGGMQVDDQGKKVKQVQLATQAVITSLDQNVDGYMYVTKFGVYSHEGATDPDQGLYRVLPQ